MKAHIFLIANPKFQLQILCSFGDIIKSVKLIGIPENNFLCIFIIASSPGVHTFFCLWRVNKITDFSLSSSLMLDACNLYTALLELKKLRGLREWLLLKEGKPVGGGGEGQTMDYTIVHGQTVSKYRCETICLKDFEVVTSWRGDVVRV